MPPRERKTLALAMIVKDEERNLPRVLESVKGCFDEIVVVDTGSKDRTKEIAVSFGASVDDFRWIDDFSAARNFAFSKAKSDFVMWLDADDVLLPEDNRRLQELRERLGDDVDAWYMKYDYAQDEFGKSTCSFFRERVVRNNGEARWAAPIHEVLMVPSSWKKANSDVVVTHRRAPEDAAKDTGRNVRILRKAVAADPKDVRLQYYFARELADSGNPEEAIRVFEDYLTKDAWHEDRVNAHLCLARAFLALHKEDKAVEACLKGIRLDPRWAEFYVTIGNVYYDRKEWANARFWFEAAARCKVPDSIGFVTPEYYTYLPQDKLCVIYWQLGERQKSYEAAEAALAHRPDDGRFRSNRDIVRNVLFPGRTAERRTALAFGRGVPVPGCIPVGPGTAEPFAPDEIPYDDASVHAIFCDREVERLPGRRARNAFFEWARKLRHNGELVLRLTDISAWAKRLLPDGPSGWEERWRDALYGPAESEDEGRTGFTRKEARSLLESAGFEILSERDLEGDPAFELTARQRKQPAKAWWLAVGTEVSPERDAVVKRLRDAGIDCRVHSKAALGDKAFETLRKADVVFMTTHEESDKALIERLRKSGVAVVYDLADGAGDRPMRDCLYLSTAVSCRSDSLAKDLEWVTPITLLDADLDKALPQWIALVERLTAEACSPPKVDVVIPTYNNLKYLIPCVQSIRRNTDWPHNLVVVDSGDDKDTREWLALQPDIRTVRSEERLTYAKAVNLGIRETRERYVCLLNNDTIVAQGWLSALVREAQKPNVGVAGPFSNCDYGFGHKEEIVVAGRPLKKISALEEVADIIPGIEAYSHRKEVVDRFWIPFYAVVVPRAVVDKVGLLDETFRNGCEDHDYCQRARKAGFRVVNTYDSFVYHFYMRTPRPEPIETMDRHNQATVGAKYDKALFVVYTGPAWERWNGASLEGDGLGGSETAAVYVSRGFAERGYRSVVFCDCKDREGEFDGVEYRDFGKFDAFADSTHMDVFVSSRFPEVFGRPIRADVKLCWAHDTAFHAKDVHADRIDRFIAVSEVHAKLLMSRYPIGPEKMFASRNGVDLSRFANAVPRQRAKLLYTSAPNRGLDVLLELFPRIRREFPEASLHIFYGFNYLDAAARRGNAELGAFIEKIRGSFDQPGVVFHGRVPLKELTEHYLSADLWAYPTDFFENFCISALEAMAAGVPVVTSDYGALTSTVGDAGVLLPGSCRTPEYKERFLEECLSMLRDRARWEAHSAKGRERAKLFPWSTVPDEWLKMIEAAKKAKAEPAGARA